MTFSRGRYVRVMFEDRTTPGADRELRFLCDEMVHGLGRYRRRASRSRTRRRRAEEDRVLLTKDRCLATTVNGAASIVLVPGDGIDEPARSLASLLVSTGSTRHLSDVLSPAARVGAAMLGQRPRYAPSPRRSPRRRALGDPRSIAG